MRFSKYQKCPDEKKRGENVSSSRNIGDGIGMDGMEGKEECGNRGYLSRGAHCQNHQIQQDARNTMVQDVGQMITKRVQLP